VITNNHVLEEDQKTTIQTSDGVIHQATRIQINRQGKDLALIKFTSKNNYTVAPLTSTTNLQANQLLYAAGYIGDDKHLTVVDGNLEAINKKPFVEGYQIGYTNDIQNGMSGGPIFNQQGQVIGINGLQAEPIFTNPYVYEDGTTPTEAEKDSYSQYSWGILLTTAAAIAPQYIALNPNAVQAITLNPIQQVEEKARAITVKVEDLTNKNQGSGFIIAHDSNTNTYTVLTAAHVVDSAIPTILPDVPLEEQTLNLSVVELTTSDGQRHSVDVKTIKKFLGKDIAILEFQSREKYQVALISKNTFAREVVISLNRKH
jgi:S1-C subfamily serine protease